MAEVSLATAPTPLAASGATPDSAAPAGATVAPGAVKADPFAKIFTTISLGDGARPPSPMPARTSLAMPSPPTPVAMPAITPPPLPLEAQDEVGSNSDDDQDATTAPPSDGAAAALLAPGLAAMLAVAPLSAPVTSASIAGTAPGARSRVAPTPTPAPDAAPTAAAAPPAIPERPAGAATADVAPVAAALAPVARAATPAGSATSEADAPSGTADAPAAPMTSVRALLAALGAGAPLPKTIAAAADAAGSAPATAPEVSIAGATAATPPQARPAITPPPPVVSASTRSDAARAPLADADIAAIERPRADRRPADGRPAPDATTPFASARVDLPPAATPQAPLLAADDAVTRQLTVARDGQWLDSLARDIAGAGGRDGKLSFALNPDTLGALTVNITQGADGASIRLTATTEAARAILADAQPRLVAEARAQGLNLREASVDRQPPAATPAATASTSTNTGQSGANARGEQGPAAQLQQQQQGGGNRRAPAAATFPDGAAAPRPVRPAAARDGLYA